jgi:formylglycine-generating enzyme required for sulfatase activity
MRTPVARNLAVAVAMVAGILCAQTRQKRIEPVAGTVREKFERQPKVAVLAGVGNYPSRSGLSTLHYPPRDVDLMQAELARQGYKVVALKDQEATRGSVRQALRDAAELVDRGSGTVLFFFSGHGFNESGTNYLATFEATSGELAGSGLAIPEVQTLLKATGALRQVMFIDACRNEPGKSAGARSFDRLSTAAGMRVLFSTKEGKISYEDDQLGSGVFTHFLVRGLRGEAAGSDGLITFRDLADFVTDGVSGYGFQKGRMQVPYEAGESSGDFLLAGPVAGNPSVPAVPPPAPGAVQVNRVDGLPYVWLEPAAFGMGCPPGADQCRKEEVPPHLVTLSRGFWIGQTEVTQEAYQRVIGVNPAAHKGAGLETVDWEEAQRYCRAVGMRLPTEAEWEYAATPGAATVGGPLLDAVAWYSDNTRTPQPVARKQPNAVGVYDMQGNVAEWTADWYGNYSAVAVTDPKGPAAAQERVVRGGAFNEPARAARVYWRSPLGPEFRLDDVGFRCAGEALPAR